MSNDNRTGNSIDLRTLRQHVHTLQNQVEHGKHVEARLTETLLEQTKIGVENEELFRLLVESVHDYAIFMLDPGGCIATWNVGAERIKGYRSDEILSKHFSIFYPDEEVRAGKCDYELAQAKLEGRFEDEGWRVRKDGTRFWANVVISAIRNDRGTLVGFSKVTRDLTHRKQAEEERAARLAAEQANSAKDQFLAMLGHELRNPLAPIVTALQLMKLRGDQRTLKEQQVIERQVRHMMHLVDDLLDVSRISRGKLELRKQRVDVRDTVAKAIELASPLLEQRSHHFDVDVPQRDLVIDADAARLTQVFANLLLNAAKYTDSGGHIFVQVKQSGGEVSVEIRDDGKGIEPDLLPKVFELFVQGEQGVERSAGGLGIGLTLVRTLVTMHGGTVEAKSPGIGQGSTFTVRLPMAGRPAVGATPASSANLFQKVIEQRRILIVDDNEDALVLLAEVLSVVGHDVKTACDSAAALGVVKEFKPDVAILDIGLPIMDGYALASCLRAELAPATPRLIALTGYGQLHDHERSRRAGFDAHLVKPVDAQRLLESIIAVDG